MNREELIKALHIAAIERDWNECKRLFGIGLISLRLYNQVLKEAQTLRSGERENCSEIG
jgi:hypothetical protein